MRLLSLFNRAAIISEGSSHSSPNLKKSPNAQLALNTRLFEALVREVNNCDSAGAIDALKSAIQVGGDVDGFNPHGVSSNWRELDHIVHLMPLTSARSAHGGVTYFHRTALEIAISANKPGIAQLLIAHSSLQTIMAHRVQLLNFAIQNGYDDIIGTLILAGLPEAFFAEKLDDIGTTPLMSASYNKRIKVAERLLNVLEEKSINAVDKYWDTALTISEGKEIKIAHLIKNALIICYANKNIPEIPAQVRNLQIRQIVTTNSPLIPELANIVSNYYGITTIADAFECINNYQIKILGRTFETVNDMFEHITRLNLEKYI